MAHLAQFLRLLFLHRRMDASGNGKRSLAIAGFSDRDLRFKDNGKPMGIFGCNCLIQQFKDDLPLCSLVETDADPFASMHPDRRREIGPVKTSKSSAAAFDVAALDLCTGIGIPLAHEKGDPFAGLRMAEH